MPETWVQENASAHVLEGYIASEAFIFAPFDLQGSFPALQLIPHEILHGWMPEAPARLGQELGRPLPQHLPTYPYPGIDQGEFIQQLQTAIQKLQGPGPLKKVVLSRPLQMSLPPYFDPFPVYHMLCRQYPQAFVYVFFHPQTGLWMGATPETLIRLEGDTLHTMSLAGTQPSQNPVPWGEKEIREQQLVTDYILQTLRNHDFQHIRAGETRTHVAGPVQHLKTEISARVPDRQGLFSFLLDLHPTPAVCGLPKEAAMRLIRDTEPYARSYYSGFLGPCTREHSLELYVNLRCMQIFRQSAALYVGGGITAESRAHLEWEETLAKSQTMAQALDRVLRQQA